MAKTIIPYGRVLDLWAEGHTAQGICDALLQETGHRHNAASIHAVVSRARRDRDPRAAARRAPNEGQQARRGQARPPLRSSRALQEFAACRAEGFSADDAYEIAREYESEDQYAAHV